MKQQFDIKFAARKYKNQNGEEKTYWSTHGSLWIDEDGKILIKLDSIPQAAHFDGYLRAFPHQKREVKNDFDDTF